MATRRLFLKNSALAMFGAGSAPAWLSRALYSADASAHRKKILIAIFQRGAMDGLNVVIPHTEPTYYRFRPTIAIPRPNGGDNGAIDLDGQFALHPALQPLKPLWDNRQLAIVEAVGSPDPTRSHFDAQDYMEAATPGLKTTSDGWLNRAMKRETQPSPLRAVSVSPQLPLTLRGHNEALAVGSIDSFQIKNAEAATAFEKMYQSSADQILNGTARETFDAMKVMQSIVQYPYVPANAAVYPNGRLGRSLEQLARLIKADVGLEVAFADVGGWDTHVDEVGSQPHVGRLSNLLREFAGALVAFHQDMGDRMEDIAIVTMSEFGRTAKENGNRGTDHGHANAMFVLGGRVRGGRIYGDWPGLEPEQLYEGRDLKVTTDFRKVLSELVARHIGNHDLQTVFPGFRPESYSGILAS